MIMPKTAWMTLRKNLIMSFITVLQFTIVLCFTAVMASSVWMRYQYYMPFQDYYNAKGLYVNYSSMAYAYEGEDKPVRFMSAEDFVSELPHVKEMIGCYGAMVYSENVNQPFRLISYDDKIIKRYQPELTEGRWLSVTNDSDIVEVVISENTYGWKVGDTIKLAAANSPSPIHFSALIVGIISDGARVFGGDYHGQTSPSCNTMFQPYTLAVEEKPILMFSHSALKSIDTGAELLDKNLDEIMQAAQYDAFLITDDFVSDEDITDIQQQLSQYGNVLSVPLNEVNENSKRYLLEQIRSMLPVVVILLILTAVSVISSSALATNSRLHDYSVFYILGLQWKNCALINLFQSIIISSVATLAATALMLIVPYSPFKNVIRVVPCSWVFLSLGVLIVLNLIISVIMPLLVLKGCTPKQILTK